jgi:hypothetical protein
MFVRIYHRRESELIGSSNLLPKVPNFDIRIPESGSIPAIVGHQIPADQMPVGFGQNGWNPAIDQPKWPEMAIDLAESGQNGGNLAKSDRIRPLI